MIRCSSHTRQHRRARWRLRLPGGRQGDIILFLPVRDVFAKVPRLSRSWKAVVDSSVRASDQALAATSERQCDSAYEVQQRSYLRELQ
jgi:hypothetical protein